LSGFVKKKIIKNKKCEKRDQTNRKEVWAIAPQIS
jgi:hypothetical protein